MNPTQIQVFKQKALQYAASFEVCSYLDSHHYSDKYGKHDCLIAFGVKEELFASVGQAFSALKTFVEQHQDWMFGLLSYDLKNEVEVLEDPKTDLLNFPDLYFFVPQYLISIKDSQISVLKGEQTVVDEILQLKIAEESLTAPVNIKNRLSKQAYLDKLESIKQHIKRGDVYEMNFCQEFFDDHAEIDPLLVYNKLKAVSPTPFSGFLKIRDQFVLSATPERFLAKNGRQLTSQPIKGTAKRSENPTEDHQIKTALRNSEKEQAENVMIVDLVRNDLTKSAVKGTVKVDELFGIYSFPQVHQMISSISCELSSNLHFVDAIKNTFPMGSMTGAPKLRAMQLIDQYEVSKRGVYSGSIGYISPNGDFDFSVVIRSILYNATNKYLSFQVGGAITYQSESEKEYEECLLKASAIMSILKN
ncbi:anthranilate synthase component I family protein [Pedobacter chitinilyticus]|uniref:Anthranilate synthase component I family protein n=1 Tax=Pedobacter chitinilyticus TaxID=2233776 RepID=A0A3S3QGU2_9SPHI|nr:anthranilate synthase component I family protein [Pedobacter chitinilyticus]RWU09813.1 anthranilate synthase component I family protein [Pedobacter chitinilyticus]